MKSDVSTPSFLSVGASQENPSSICKKKTPPMLGQSTVSCGPSLALLFLPVQARGTLMPNIRADAKAEPGVTHATWTRLSIVRVVMRHTTLFPVHARLNLFQLALACQELLSLLVDLALYLDFNLAQLLLLAAQLLLLQTH